MAPWIDIAGWTLLHFVWQGTAIGLAAAVGFRLLRTTAPHVRYLLASASMATMLIAPVATAARLSSSASALAAPRISASTISLASAPRSPDVVARDVAATSAVRASAGRSRLDAVLPAIVLLWLIGVALLQLRLIGGWWRVRRLHRASLATTPSAWQAMMEPLAKRLGLRHLVHVVETHAVDVPTVIGWWRPVILLPVGALAGLTPGQADAILVHELAHIRRHDYLVNALQHVTETLLFYHPAVWWISRRMRIEREQCCDALVVQLCGDPIDYAAALAELEGSRSRRLVLAVAATDGSLVHRIRVLLGAQPSHQQPLADALVTALVVVALVVVTGGGYRWPVSAVRASVPPVPRAEMPAVGTAAGAVTAQRADEAPRGQAQQGADVPGRATAAKRAPSWQTYATDHFDIFFTPDLNTELERVGREAERAYQRLSADLRHDLGARLNLVLLATGAARANGIGVPSGAAGTPSRILLALDRPEDRFRADVAHEVTHAFEFDILPAAVVNDGPAWIWEGLAEHEGEVWASGDDVLLRGLVRADSVPALSAFESPAERRLSYCLGHAAFDFIAARWGLDGIRRLLFTLRQRQAADRGGLYPAAFGIPAEEFDRAFERYLRDRFPSSSLDPPVATRAQSIDGERIEMTVPLSYRQDKTVFLGSEPVLVAVLEKRVQQKMQTAATKDVFVRGDGALNLSEIVEITEILKAAGVEHVGFEGTLSLPGR
jgi:beta-lactamase regulating signal transducer with metallopeptidase domain